MSVLPFIKNFEIFKNNTFSYPWVLTSGTNEGSQPVDLTGLTATLVLKNPTTNVTLATYTSSASPGTSGIFYGGTTGTPVNGTIDIVIIAADTNAITWQVANYTLTLTGVSTQLVLPSTVLKGAFFVSGVVL